MNAVNAVIYARYSSDRQTEQSIEGQVRYCLDYADRCGLNIVGEYIDRALSGTSDNRPEFQQMIADSSKKQFKIVLVYKLDRFARNVYDSVAYEHKLAQNGVKLISVTEPIGEGDEALILKSVLTAMAEMYSRQLSTNVRRGMRESALKGNSTGGTIPLGYKLENKKLVIDEMTAPAIRYIFEAYAAGDGKIEISRALHEMGYKTTTGRRFSADYLTRVLTNKKYIGVFHYDDIEVKDGCPAIVSPQLFEKCKQRSERDKRRFGRTKKEDVNFLLFGKIYCGHCGKPIIGDSGTSKGGNKYLYYSCTTRKNRHRDGGNCTKKSEKKEFIEWYVVQQTREYILDPGRIKYISDKVAESFNSPEAENELKKLQSQLTRINKEIDISVDALLKTTHQIALDKINERIEILERQKIDTETEIAKAKIASGLKVTAAEIESWLRAYCTGDALDPNFQERIINAFIQRIYLFDDKIVIYYNVKHGQQVSLIDALEDLEDMDDSKDNSTAEGNISTKKCSSNTLLGSPHTELLEHYPETLCFIIKMVSLVWLFSGINSKRTVR